MTSLYDYVKYFFLRKAFATEITVKEITRSHILILHKEINRAAFDNFDAYHLQYWQNPNLRNEIEAGFRTDYFVDKLKNPQKPNEDQKFIPRPDSIERLYDPCLNERIPLTDKINDALALSVAACGYRDYCNDTLDNIIHHHKLARNETIEGNSPQTHLVNISREIKVISNRLPEWNTINSRNQLNASLLKLASNGVIDFDDIMANIVREKSIDTVSFYQLSAIPHHELTLNQRKSLVILSVWILARSFDLKVYTIFKNQWMMCLDEDLSQMIILSLSTLKLVHNKNSTINRLLKSDLELMSMVYFQKNIDENEKINPKVVQINYNHLENSMKFFELLSKESIILILKRIVNVSDTQNSVIPYMEKLHSGMNDLINDHLKFLDIFPKFKIVVSLRRAIFVFGKKDLMITSKQNTTNNSKNHYLGTAYEIVKQNENEGNVLGIPLLIDEKVKNELDSLFGLE